uniref:Uncharacterized protein n=1 Tax=Cyprinus carpio TaxID=7962 RepID=A0A8C2L2D7_CYPCA
MSVYEEKEQEATVDAQRAASPGFSSVSMKSNDSIFLPPNLSDVDAQRAASPGFSRISMKSNNSKFLPPELSDVDAQRAASPGFSSVSMKSNDSIFLPPNLSDVDAQRAVSPGFSRVSMKSNNSIFLPPNLSDGPAVVSDPVIISRNRKRAASPVSSCVSMKSNKSIVLPLYLRDEPVTSDSVLTDCDLTDRHCEILASVLQSSNSLREMDLSNNHLQDSGVELLSAGLKSSNCQLNILRLSQCLVTAEGCAALASALSSNPSHLRELDLSYNHPGDSVKLLRSCHLETLKQVEQKQSSYLLCV